MGSVVLWLWNMKTNDGDGAVFGLPHWCHLIPRAARRIQPQRACMAAETVPRVGRPRANTPLCELDEAQSRGSKSTGLCIH
jgi:hypothetical protein